MLDRDMGAARRGNREWWQPWFRQMSAAGAVLGGATVLISGMTQQGKFDHVCIEVSHHQFLKN